MHWPWRPAGTNSFTLVRRGLPEISICIPPPGTVIVANWGIFSDFSWALLVTRMPGAEKDYFPLIERFEPLVAVISSNFGKSRLMWFVPSIMRLPLTISRSVSRLAAVLLVMTRFPSNTVQPAFVKSLQGAPEDRNVWYPKRTRN